MFGKDENDNQNKIEQLEEAIEKLEARVVELESVLEIEPEEDMDDSDDLVEEEDEDQLKKEPVFKLALLLRKEDIDIEKSK